MFAKTITGSLFGLDAELTLVEVDLAAGIPGFTTVGLPDVSVKEAKDRIRAAIVNSGYQFPAKRITVNLSPANKKKEGTHYDLPIAIGILAASRQIGQERIEEFAFIGELSLDGQINPVRGVLPLVIGFRQNGIRKIILPPGNVREAAMLTDISLYPADTLFHVIETVRQGQEPARHMGESEHYIYKRKETAGDFAEVAGQDGVKRAMQIAAAAQHNLIMLGPPGVGKTMLARRLPGILPSMTYEEKLEITQIYSIAGALEAEGILEERPFRAPHHTISSVALVGGGRDPKPGEVSLAHRGVLYLDELPEFNRYAIEMLRQPIEDGYIVLTRVAGTYTYPSKCMLVISMNPCPCGNFGSPTQECTCTPGQIQKYLSRLSSPLLDRIDLQLEVCSVSYRELSGRGRGKTSAQMRREVEQARAIQLKRYEKDGIRYNAELDKSLMEKYCKLDIKSRDLMEKAFHRLNLSARAYTRIIRLARTIADLEGREVIRMEDIAEAIQYRSLDKKYRWQS